MHPGVHGGALLLEVADDGPKVVGSGLDEIDGGHVRVGLALFEEIFDEADPGRRKHDVAHVELRRDEIRAQAVENERKALPVGARVGVYDLVEQAAPLDRFEAAELGAVHGLLRVGKTLAQGGDMRSGRLARGHIVGLGAAV